MASHIIRDRRAGLPRHVTLLALLAICAAPACDEASAPSWPGPLVLAGFNVHFLTTSDEGRDFGRLSEIIARYDMVGLCEVQQAAALDELVGRLGGDWRYVMADRWYGGGSFTETYAFLYRGDHVRLVAGSAHTYAGTADLTRPPFHADFRAGGFDFTMAVVHTVWGDGDLEKRRAEVRALTQVLDDLQGASPSEDDVVLVGDFNLPPDDGAWDYVHDTGARTLVAAPYLTTLGTEDLANLYDNVLIFPDKSTEFTGSWGTFDFASELYDGDYPAAKAAISDHLPVWAVFDTGGPDDD